MIFKKIITLLFVSIMVLTASLAHDTDENASDFEKQIEDSEQHIGASTNDLSVLLPWKHIANGNWGTAFGTLVFWLIFIFGVWNLLKVVLYRLIA